MAQPIPSTTPVRVLGDHGDRVIAVAVFPDKQRMVTGSYDAILRLWDLKTGVVTKKMEGHRHRVQALAVSRDGQFIASGDTNRELFAWDGKTGEPLTKAISAYTGWILSLDFSLDGKVLVSGSSDSTVALWSTSTWQQQVTPINCGTSVRCVRYSPSQSHVLAIATEQNIQIYHAGYGTWGRYGDEFYYSCNGPSFQAQYEATISGGFNFSLAWTPDGTRLLSAGGGANPTIREWCSSSWQQVGDPFKGHFNTIRAISINSKGTLLASASHDNRVRLWRLSDRRTISAFKHSGEVTCVTFSADDTHILSGGVDKRISEWSASEDTLPGDGPKDVLMKVKGTHQPQAHFDPKVLAMDSTVRNACIARDWPTAEKVLDLDIDLGTGDHNSYTNRAFVMVRKCDWDHALHDAIKSLNIQPSLAGYITKGIALCGQKHVRAARTSFDLASMFTNGDLQTDHLLFFIKTIALFNANEHEEAMERIEELAVSPDADPLACRTVEAYLRVQLGKIALDHAHYKEAVDHFTAAVDASVFFYKLDIHSMYEEFVVLFGWDLKSLWQTVNQLWQTANLQHCRALFQTGRIGAASELHQFIMDKSDEDMKASLCAWFAALKSE